jgi:hypothetical protein
MHAKMFIAAGLLLGAAPAFADDPGAGAPAAPDPNAGGAGAAAGASTGAAAGAGVAAEAPAPKLWIGGGLEMHPVGTVSFSAGGVSGDAGTDTGVFGVDVVALYRVHPMVMVGLAPRYILNIKGGNATDSAKMLDIRAVAAVGKDVAPKIHAFGMVGLGYASISVPDQMGMSSPSPAGLTASFAGGAGYALGPKLMATAMLSYELGFESVSVGGQSADYKYNYLSFGVGILAAVM